MNNANMMTKPFVILPLLLVLSLPLMGKQALSDVDMWLPSTYQDHYLRLLDAAKKVRLDPYCTTLLSGGLAESRSKPDHPTFSFVCRTEQGRSFSILVDGKTLALTNAYGERQQQLERDRIAEQQRILDEKDKEKRRVYEDELKNFTHWLVCDKSMKKRLKLFENVEILTETPPQPDYDFESGKFHYVVNFNSQSPSRKRLKFTFECHISSLDEHKVSIFPRKKA